MSEIIKIQKTIVGRVEWANLLDFDIDGIKVKIDTGAKSSTIHAENIRIRENKKGQNIVYFTIHPLHEDRKIKIKCKSQLIDWKKIISSNNTFEIRPVIKTKIKIGNKIINSKLSLTNRGDMTYPVLLGRADFKDWAVVEADKVFLQGELDPLEIYKDLIKEHSKNNQTLNIGILGNTKDLYSNKRLIEEITNKGHKAEFIKIEKCYLRINSNTKSLFYKNENIQDKFDVILSRIGVPTTHFGTTILRHFQTSGVVCINNPEAILNTRDKFKTYQLLSQKHIPLPDTGFSYSYSGISKLVEEIGEPPIIIKLLKSTQGKGVILAESKVAAKSMLGALKNIKADVMVQEYIKESKGRDIRAFVVGNKVVASIERIVSDENEFRSNIHMGGVGKKINLTKKEKEIAIIASKVLSLDISGVDLIHSNEGLLVLEVNSSPGLEGIEKATEVNIAKKIVEYIEKKIFSKRT